MGYNRAVHQREDLGGIPSAAALPLLIQAGMVLPVCGPPVADGAVRLRGGIIETAGPARDLPPLPGERVLSLPDCVLLPGLVNAHCHLELGMFHGSVPYPGSFPGWILSLVGRGRPEADAVAQSIHAGVRALLAGGATCVGDITATGLAREPLRQSGIRALSYRELLGLTPDRCAPALADARAWIEGPKSNVQCPISEVESLKSKVERHAGTAPAPFDFRPSTFDRRVRSGISPHAPYSTSALIYSEAVRLAGETSVPFTTHLSESLEEIEFLARGTGGFREIQHQRAIPPEAWPTPGCSPIRYLADLGVLALSGTAIHVNYLQPGDLELLAAGRLVPVYCPGSHRFFRHPPHPAGEMLRAGIAVALGTDSLASNDGLDMLAEARTAWQSVANTTAQQWIHAATAVGARALGLADLCGTLAPGKCADLIAVSPGKHAPDPYAAVLAAGSRVRLTMVAGEVLYSLPEN